MGDPRHSEIARRYRWQQRHRRKSKPFSLASIRVAELDRLFTCRHGKMLPVGRLDLVTIMANHLAMMSGDPRWRIVDWISYRAGWLPIGDLDALLADVLLKPQRYKADALAWKLGLTYADRTTLGITTIGAIDLSKSQRKRRRLERERLRKQAERRANGILPKPKANKPWLMRRMSRAKWYRLRKRETK